MFLVFVGKLQFFIRIMFISFFFSISVAVFEPMIDRVCDPDWINQRLVSYLRQQQAAEELHRRTYMYAASYEDFITLIHESTDIHDLEHLR